MKINLTLPTLGLFTLTLCFFVSIACSLHPSDADASAFTAKTAVAPGAISGCIVCENGDDVHGEVSIFLDYTFVAYQEVASDGSFRFIDLGPADYTLNYYERGFIPVVQDMSVEVFPAELTEISIEIPLSPSCSDILEMDFMEFSSLAGESWGSYIFCEAGMDAVALIYGSCVRDYNDDFLSYWDETNRDIIDNLRDKIYAVERAYLLLEWTGGTGSGHMLARAMPSREFLISDIITDFHSDSDNPDALADWTDMVADLYSVADYFEEQFEEWEYDVLRGVPDDLKYAVNELDDAVKKLPTGTVSLITDYMHVYSVILDY